MTLEIFVPQPGSRCTSLPQQLVHSSGSIISQATIASAAGASRPRNGCERFAARGAERFTAPGPAYSSAAHAASLHAGADGDAPHHAEQANQDVGPAARACRMMQPDATSRLAPLQSCPEGGTAPVGAQGFFVSSSPLAVPAAARLCSTYLAIVPDKHKKTMADRIFESLFRVACDCKSEDEAGLHEPLAPAAIVLRAAIFAQGR